jgi:endonuclease/exonuclease/phosphatase family metal-dependent hydrolase
LRPLPDADTLSVLTLNLRFGLARDGKNSWDRREKAYPALFSGCRPDFIGFQEANDFQIVYLKKILSEYESVGIRSPAPDFWQNNVLFYKRSWQCLASEHLFLSPTPEIPSRARNSRWPRQCTLGMFGRGDRRLICVNTHFDFDTEVQTASAALILDRISRLSDTFPAVLIGDFNAPPGSAPYRVFTGRTRGEIADAGNFRNAFHPPFTGTHHAFTGIPAGKPIDWILYRGGLEPETAEVIDGKFNGIYPSDHFPLHAIFRWTVR